MAKKLSLLLAATAVVAFAVPAFANAAPELTVGGVKAGLGTDVTGISTNTVTKTSLGNLTCATVEVDGEVFGNTGTTVEVKTLPPTKGKTTTCFFKGVTPITIHDPTLLKLHTATKGSGTVSLTFEATLPELTCHYSGTAVPFTYTTGGSSIVIKGGLTAKPAACGTASIEGTYGLSSTKGAVVLH